MNPETLRARVVKRFWSHVNKTDTCWVYTGYVHKNGYGQFFDGKQRRVHRWAYEFLVGPIPDGLVLDHTCHNEDASCINGDSCLHRRCVNPAHLEPITSLDNIRRGNGSLRERNKTHCPKGHPYEGNNIYHDPRGNKRGCMACITERNRNRAKKVAV